MVATLRADRALGLLGREWYAAALSSEVEREPRAADVLGVPYVLYRDRSGRAVAHLDRCPHRNVPLSQGRCTGDDTIECAYHGWQFSPDGACVNVPGLVTDLKKGRRVETFATIEKYGLVWLCPVQGAVPEAEPILLEEASRGDYTVVARRAEFPGGLFAVVENALDVPHTAVLHRGLFRTGQRQDLDVVVRRYHQWAEAEYIGEEAPKGLVARLLSLGGRGGDLTVRHWDRFILPSALQVEYRLGERTHFLITGFCTPHGPNETTVFAVVCIKTPLFRFLERLLVRFIEPFARRVVAQDVRVLRAQTETVDRFGGERFMSTEVDVLSTSIRRLLKDAADHEAKVQMDGGESAGLSGGRRDPHEQPREVAELQIRA